MSTPSYVDLESITQADGAQSSRVPIPLPDDPYVAVRVPFLGEKFKAVEPLGTRTDSSYSSVSLDFTASWSPDHPLTYVSPTPTPTPSKTEAMALSDLAFCKRYRSSYETPLPSLTLLVRKRYRGTSELILDTNSEGDELGDEDIDKDEEDESLDADDGRDRLDDENRDLDDEDRGLDNKDRGLDDEDRSLDDEGLGLGYRALRRRELAVDKDQVFSTFEPTLGIWVDLEDGMIYTDIPAYAPPVPPIQTPPSPEWSFNSLHILPSFPIAPSPIASPVATLTATISIDEDQFLEVRAQLELHGSILHDHTQHLDALPPTSFVDIDRDVRDLYTRSRVAGHVDTQLADTSWDRYDDQKLIHNMLVQQATMQRELQEMRGHVATLE
nr:hypothetical protein [Tanacetum cinerariifolium]